MVRVERREHGMGGGQGPERAAEVHQLVRREVLVAGHQHLVAGQGGVEVRGTGLVEGAEVGADQLSGEGPAERGDGAQGGRVQP